MKKINIKKHKIEIIIMIFLFLFNVVFSITLGYAYDNKQETPNTASLNGRFELLFDNAKVENQIGVNKEKTSIDISSDLKSLYLNVGDLEYPGAYVEYSAYIYNSSAVVVNVDSIECEGMENAKAIKIEEIEELKNNLKLKPSEKYKLCFKVKWDEHYNDNSNEKVNFELKINFSQDV